MAERSRDTCCVLSAILRGWVTLMLNFRLKGYVSPQYRWTFTTVPLKVCTQRNFVADFIRMTGLLNFIKNKNWLSEQPFGGLTGNVYALRL